MKKRKKADYEHNPLDLSEIKVREEELDEWQKEVLNYKGNIAIRAGRQVGKSYIMAKKAAKFALENAKVKILISASSERQAMYLFEKLKYELKWASDFDVFADVPTMRIMRLKNGSEIYCLPTGQTGDLIRGLTLDVWIPDEASFIDRNVFVAVTPMLWISRKEKGFGWIWALSTPFGKQGDFYEMFNNPDFKTWHIKSTECQRIPQEELEKWKKQFTRIQYAQEVLGEFIDEVSRLFTEELLKKCFRKGVIEIGQTNILGVDVARYGKDENAFVNANTNGKRYVIPRAEVSERKAITDTFRKIDELNKIFDYKKIIIDDAGVGGGLTDFLIQKFRAKILGVNNAKRNLQDDRTKSVMKEDLYSNALILMEQGKVEIEDNDDLYTSLSSMLFEYEGDKLKIYGRYSHLAEAFVRALWYEKTKHLNIFVYGF